MAMTVYSPLNRELRLCPKTTVNEWMDVQYSTERSSQYYYYILLFTVMCTISTIYVLYVLCSGCGHDLCQSLGVHSTVYNNYKRFLTHMHQV